MRNDTTLVAAALLMVCPCTGSAEEAPIAPTTAAEAVAAGLKRVDATELGQRYGGARLLITDKGQAIRLELHPDGTLDYLDDKGGADNGNWLVQTRNGGSVCRRYSKQMGGRTCVVYFAAPDGVYWFGYGADDGRWRDTTRPLTGP
jgi:hypothetical protein